MKQAFLMLIAACLAACSTEVRSSRDFVMGSSWKRSVDFNGLGEQLRFDVDGRFSYTVFGGGSSEPYDEDPRNIQGTYEVRDDELRIVGTNSAGNGFDYSGSYYADEVTFIRAAYLLSEQTETEDTYRAFQRNLDSDWDGEIEIEFDRDPFGIQFDYGMEDPDGEYTIWVGAGVQTGVGHGDWKQVAERIEMRTHGGERSFVVVGDVALASPSSPPWVDSKFDEYAVAFERVPHSESR